MMPRYPVGLFFFLWFMLSPYGEGQRLRGRTEMARPLGLAGQVVVENGGDLPNGVHVALVCKGSTMRETYVDVQGRFSIQVRGQSSDEAMTAEVSNFADADVRRDGPVTQANSRGDLSQSIGVGADDRTRVNLSECILRAVASGYASDFIHLGIRRVTDSPNVGVLTLSRGDAPRGTSISLNSLSAPAKAKNAFEEALLELGKPKPQPQRAVQHLKKATEIYPAYAEAWQLLGRIHQSRKDLRAAQEAFQEARKADPAYVKPYLSLAKMAADGSSWEEAEALGKEVLELDSSLIEAHYYCGLAQFNLGNVEQAHESILKVRQSDQVSEFPGTYYILGAILAFRGEVPAAVSEFEEFLKINPEAPAAQRLRLQIQEWEAQGLLESSN